VCGAIGLAMSAVSAAVSCGDAAFGGGSWGECAVGAAGVLVGGAGMVAARSLSAADKVVNVFRGTASGPVVQVGAVGPVHGNLSVFNVFIGKSSGPVTQIGAVGPVHGNLSVFNVFIGKSSGPVTQIRSTDEAVHVSSPAGKVTLSPSGDITITP
jgi:hypothetical protein